MKFDVFLDEGRNTSPPITSFDEQPHMDSPQSLEYCEDMNETSELHTSEHMASTQKTYADVFLPGIENLSPTCPIAEKRINNWINIVDFMSTTF